MNLLLAEIFGYILIASAAVLGAWEVRAYRHRHVDAWLVTSRRLRRRFAISVVLGLIGLIIALEGRYGIPGNRPGYVIAFATGIMGLSVLLMVMAGADVLDTIRSATAQSLRELERAVQPPPQQSGTNDDSEAPQA